MGVVIEKATGCAEIMRLVGMVALFVMPPGRFEANIRLSEAVDSKIISLSGDA